MNSIVQKFSASNLPIKTVILYSGKSENFTHFSEKDQAELKRVFKVSLKEGDNEIVIENVSQNIKHESIRVDVNSSNAIIQEVELKKEHVTNEEIDPPKVKELLEQIKVLDNKRSEMQNLKEIYEKRLDSLNEIISNLGKTALEDETNEGVLNFDESIKESLEKLYKFHEKKSLEIQQKLSELKEEIQMLLVERSKLYSKLGAIQGKNYHKHPKRFSIVIKLETTKLTESLVVELEVSYLVSSAFWYPSYDVRAKTITDGSKDSKLKIYYYGSIRQECGEDWNDVELLFSTAKPTSRGYLPKLTTKRVKIYSPPIENISEPRTMLFGMSMSRRSKSSNDSDTSDADMGFGVFQSPAIPEQQLLSTTFKIPQRKTIPSDNTSHKVAIAVLEFVPILHYDCVPSKNTNVFLTATAINTSAYPILVGDASIYLNNSFSSKVKLKLTSPGEKFDCPLGVDLTQKVQYRPTNKFQQQIGFINKCAVKMNEQKIQLKNTKSLEKILLTIFLQLPKSADEKVKVKLISPTDVKQQNGSGGVNGSNICLVDSATPSKLKLPEVGISIDDQNIIKWTLQLAESEEKELTLKYSIEYPQNETLLIKDDGPDLD